MGILSKGYYSYMVNFIKLTCELQNLPMHSLCPIPKGKKLLAGLLATLSGSKLHGSQVSGFG